MPALMRCSTRMTSTPGRAVVAVFLVAVCAALCFSSVVDAASARMRLKGYDRPFGGSLMEPVNKFGNNPAADMEPVWRGYPSKTVRIRHKRRQSRWDISTMWNAPKRARPHEFDPVWDSVNHKSHHLFWGPPTQKRPTIKLPRPNTPLMWAFRPDQHSRPSVVVPYPADDPNVARRAIKGTQRYPQVTNPDDLKSSVDLSPGPFDPAEPPASRLERVMRRMKIIPSGPRRNPRSDRFDHVRNRMEEEASFARRTTGGENKQESLIDLNEKASQIGQNSQNAQSSQSRQTSQNRQSSDTQDDENVDRRPRQPAMMAPPPEIPINRGPNDVVLPPQPQPEHLPQQYREPEPQSQQRGGIQSLGSGALARDPEEVKKELWPYHMDFLKKSYNPHIRDIGDQIENVAHGKPVRSFPKPPGRGSNGLVRPHPLETIDWEKMKVQITDQLKQANFERAKDVFLKDKQSGAHYLPYAKAPAEDRSNMSPQFQKLHFGTNVEDPGVQLAPLGSVLNPIPRQKESYEPQQEINQLHPGSYIGDPYRLVRLVANGVQNLRPEATMPSPRSEQSEQSQESSSQSTSD